MKKLLVVIAALCIAASAHAQIGLMAGVTSSESNIKDAAANIGDVTQYHVGVALKLNLGLIAIQPSILYNIKGSTLTENVNALTGESTGTALDTGTKTTTNQTGYLEVPVQLQVGIPLLGVCAVRNKSKNALFAKLAELCKVNHCAVDRSTVNLKVTRMNYRADGCMDSKHNAVRNRVIGVNNLNNEISKTELVACLDCVKLILIKRAVFFELAFYKPDCKVCSVNRNIKLLKYIRKCADMVLMTVSYYYSDNLFSVFQKIRYIGYNKVNARHFIIRKRKPAVNDKYAVLVLVNVHIFADFVKSSERIKFKL